MTRRDPASPAERGADTIHWACTRLDTVERLALYPRSIQRTCTTLADSLGACISNRELWDKRGDLREGIFRTSVRKLKKTRC